MSLLKDETGNRYGQLTVLERVPNKNGTKARWLCRCDCGKLTEADGDQLRQNNKISCGHPKYGSENNHFKGGHYRDRLYHVWMSMKQRCSNPKNQKYKYYGARGVTFCQEWSEYETFRSWAYANGYNDKGEYGETTLDRINQDGNYEPNNCRFVSLSIQNKNRHKFHYLKEEPVNGD